MFVGSLMVYGTTSDKIINIQRNVAHIKCNIIIFSVSFFLSPVLKIKNNVVLESVLITFLIYNMYHPTEEINAIIITCDNYIIAEKYIIY